MRVVKVKKAIRIVQESDHTIRNKRLTHLRLSIGDFVNPEPLIGSPNQTR